MSQQSPNLACPSCSSDETRRLSLVHAEGRAAINGSVSAGALCAGSTGLGGGIGHGSLRAQSVTELSAMAAPPRARPGSLWPGTLALLALIFVTATITTGAFGFTLPMPIALCAAAVVAGLVAMMVPNEADTWNRRELPKLRAEWERKFFCRKCGAVFIPTAPPRGDQPALRSVR